jgi:hypothetical protein
MRHRGGTPIVKPFSTLLVVALLLLPACGLSLLAQDAPPGPGSGPDARAEGHTASPAGLTAAADVPAMRTFLPLLQRDYDPLLYDDFENPVYDGAYNATRWKLTAHSAFDVRQGAGSLIVTNLAADGNIGAGLVMLQPPERTLWQLQEFEARLAAGSDHSGGYTTVKIQISSDDIAGHGWWTQCTLGASVQDPPFFICDVTTHDALGTNSEYVTPPVPAAFNTWYLARIEADPNTAELRFYLDGALVGSHTPADAAALKAATNLRSRVGAWNQAPYAAGSRFVDDVRVTWAPAGP